MASTKQEVGSIGAPPLWQRASETASDFLRQMLRQPIAMVGMIVVLIYLLLALIGPAISPYPFDESLEDPNNCITRSSGAVACAALREAPPSEMNLLGTDRNGRDVFSRILYGARETIGLPTAATLLSVTLGAILGLATGYIGGWFDEFVSRAMDSLLAIPALVLALVALTTIVPIIEEADNLLTRTIGATNIALIIVIVLLYTPIVTRIVRSATLSLRDRGYVEAARLRGESTPYILFREILPGVLPALVVEASLRFSYAIFLVASLGFLGLGAQPPSPEWGRMVLDARSNYAAAPWALWAPVFAIATLIISVNLFSDGLRRIFRRELERN